VDFARQSFAAGRVRPVEIMLQLLALQRLGRSQEAEQLGPEMLDLLRGNAWEQTLIRLILGQVSGEQALAQAASEEQRFQAHYYAGARALSPAGRQPAARPPAQPQPQAAKKPWWKVW
jgi:hypothetical protein